MLWKMTMKDLREFKFIFQKYNKRIGFTEKDCYYLLKKE